MTRSRTWADALPERSQHLSQLLYPLVIFVLCERALWHFKGAGTPGVARVLVAVPFLLAFGLALRIGFAWGRAGLRLDVHRATEDASVAAAVVQTWSYERDRYRRSLARAAGYAAAFGALATVYLSAAVLAIFAFDSPASRNVAASGAAATVASFLIQLTKVTVRVARHDISASAFAWAMRTLTAVLVADIGLALVADLTLPHAVMLGILAAVLGAHALDLLMEKVPNSLGLGSGARRAPSPLMALDGIVEEHAERLEEEGILTVNDLAHAPTARLFFNTPYGLQTICDWQDQALLAALVTLERARDLRAQLGLRSATALRAAAHALKEKGAGPTRAALRRALRLDQNAPLEPLLDSILADEATLRVQVHARSAVLEPAQFEEREQRRQAGAGGTASQENRPGRSSERSSRPGRLGTVSPASPAPH